MERSLGAALAEQPIWRRFIGVNVAFGFGGFVVAITAWQLTGSEQVTWIALFAGLGIVMLIARSAKNPEPPTVRKLTTHWSSAVGAIIVLVVLDIVYLLPPVRPFRNELHRLGGPTLVSWLFAVVMWSSLRATFMALEIRHARRVASP